MYTTAEIVKAMASDKLQLNRAVEDLVLVEVKSNGERAIYKDNDVSVATTLSLSGRIFVTPKDHLDALTPLAEQEVASEGLDIDIDALSTKELAYHMTLFDWDLFWAVHEYELLYYTFGRHHFNKVFFHSI
jgi:Rap guanine nucleotide exchange factor 4